MTDAAGHIPEIGVTVDDEAEQPSVQVLAPLTGKNGVLLRMCMFDMQKARWISGSGVTTSARVVHRRHLLHPHTRYAYDTSRLMNDSEMVLGIT